MMIGRVVDGRGATVARIIVGKVLDHGALASVIDGGDRLERGAAVKFDALGRKPRGLTRYSVRCQVTTSQQITTRRAANHFARVEFRSGGGCTGTGAGRCHSPHESPRKWLLRGPDRKICMQCHAATLLNGSTVPAHADAKVGCLECHFGHGGDNSLMLRVGATAAGPPRRPEFRPPPV